MKNLILIILAVFTFSNTYSQEKNNKKIVETSFHVDGACDDCKKRIEEATLRISGVKLAEWDKENKQLKVIYKNKKTTEKDIQQTIANRGHSTSEYPADSTAYEKLPKCCMYNEEGVESH